MTLYMAGVAAVLLIAFCTLQGDFALPSTATGWVGFVAAALFYAFAMIAFFIAVAMIGPTRSSMLCYAEPVVSAGLGVVLLGETLTLVQVSGIFVVVGALVGATLLQQRPINFRLYRSLPRISGAREASASLHAASKQLQAPDLPKILLTLSNLSNVASISPSLATMKYSTCKFTIPPSLSAESLKSPRYPMMRFRARTHKLHFIKIFAGHAPLLRRVSPA